MSRFLGGLLVVIACGAAPLVARAAGRQDAADPTPGPLAGIEVAVTVDDLPAVGGPLPPERTPMDVVRALVAALRDQSVPAWGFANGYQLEWQAGMIDILQAWLTAYPLGNHGYHHADLNTTPVDAYIADIDATDRLLQTLTLGSALADRRRVFRYPYLGEGDTPAKRDAVRAHLAAYGYRIAHVTVDYYDWAWDQASARCLAMGDAATRAKLMADVVDVAAQSLLRARARARQLFDRDIAHILLIHPNAFTADTLPAILARLRSGGVKFITLEDALADPAYQTDPHVADAASRGFLDQVEISRGIESPDDVVMSGLDPLCRESAASR